MLLIPSLTEPAPKHRFFFPGRFAFILLLLFGILGLSGTVLAKDSQPGSLLFPVKQLVLSAKDIGISLFWRSALPQPTVEPLLPIAGEKDTPSPTVKPTGTATATHTPTIPTARKSPETIGVTAGVNVQQNIAPPQTVSPTGVTIPLRTTVAVSVAPSTAAAPTVPAPVQTDINVPIVDLKVIIGGEKKPLTVTIGL